MKENFDLKQEYISLYRIAVRDSWLDLARMCLNKILVIEQLEYNRERENGSSQTQAKKA